MLSVISPYMDNIFVIVANLCHIIHFACWLILTSVSIWYFLAIKCMVWACMFSEFVICNSVKDLLYQSPQYDDEDFTQSYLHDKPLERLVRTLVSFILFVSCMVMYLLFWLSVSCLLRLHIPTCGMSLSACVRIDGLARNRCWSSADALELPRSLIYILSDLFIS